MSDVQTICTKVCQMFILFILRYDVRNVTDQHVRYIEVGIEVYKLNFKLYIKLSEY